MASWSEGSKGRKNKAWVSGLVRKHFGDIQAHQIVTASRSFPVTARVDLQRVLETWFARHSPKASVTGAHAPYSHETLTFSHLLTESDLAPIIAPLQYEEIDIGDLQPARCLKCGLWLGEMTDTRFAVWIARDVRLMKERGVYVEVATLPGEAGSQLARQFFDEIERKIAEAGSYRGKVLSLESSDNYSGTAGSVKVHRLPVVTRGEIVLPARTLALLERNVLEFVTQRQQLSAMRMPVKKGLLFYGPPGTGKTFTIQYLASQLPGHTTLLITSSQVALLGEYMQLARFLQPAMVVIEDVDLIARARTSMRNPCEESLLNQLLNEMDGLREDSAVLFVLTTNHPEQLEAALASRPGRIDQAIEFPLPDEEGRRKLVHLYARGLTVSDDLVELIVQKTKNGSPALIKELMRRSAQYLLRGGGQGELRVENVEAALDEMLFAGGKLNLQLLGASGVRPVNE